MAGEVSKEELERVLTQAMLAQKNIQPQLNRLLQLRRRLQRQPSPSDDNVTAGIVELVLDVEYFRPAVAAGLNDLAVMRMDFADTIKHVNLAPEIITVYFAGVRVRARAIHRCLVQLAPESGARLALDPALAGAIPTEELYDALVAQQLPSARPATLTEALDRVQAAFFALKLSREHHLPLCVEHLTGGAIQPPPLVGEPSDNRTDDEKDPVDGATERLAETVLSGSYPAPDAAATGEPSLASIRSSMDHDKALTNLDRACALWSLVVDHIDHVVTVFSSFLDPKEVTSLSDYTDSVADAESVSFVLVIRVIRHRVLIS